MTNKALVDLAAQINGLRQQVETLSQPSLGYSSLEDGAIPEFDREGGQVAQYGTQFDGSHMAASLSGPVPPIPSAPIVTPVAGGLSVRWDGFWADPLAVTPMDFSRIEVHVSTDPGFDRSAATFLRATIETPRGGEAVIVPLPYVEHTVALVARSLSGKSSIASVPVVGTPTKITTVDLDFDPSDLAGSTIFWGDEPTTQIEGDYWLQPPDNALTRWDGDSWEDVSDLGITEAIQAAAAAQGAADTASGQASAAQAAADLAAGQAAQALTDAQTAQSTADGKANIYFQASAPTGMVAGDLNDLWIDTDDTNKAYIWDGNSWELAADQRIGTALANANAAQTAVATKAATFFQTTAPSTTGRTTGDLWFDTDDGNKLYRWSGSAWVAGTLGAAALNVTVGGGNLLVNSAFRDGETNWADRSPASATAVTVVDDPYLGEPKALRIEVPTPATDVGKQSLTRPDVSPGDRVTFSFYVRRVSGTGTPSMGVEFFTSASAYLNGRYLVVAINADGTYKRNVMTVTVPAGAATTKVMWYTPGGVAGDVYHIKMAQFEIGDVVTAYAPKTDEILPGTVSAAMVAFVARDIGAITTYWQITAPTGTLKTGDLWIDIDDKNKTYRWDGDSWELAADQRIAEAISSAAGAQATADGKVKTFAQAAAPVAEAAGDLWVDTDDGNKLYRWSGSAWVVVQDASIATAQTAATNAAQAAAAAQADADAANTAALNAAGIANSKGKVYYQVSAPAGDPNGLWIDIDDGNKPYRWSGSAWVVVQDASIQAAASAAAAAQSDADAAATLAQTAKDTADAANALAAQAKSAADSKITVYRQATAPAGGTYKINGDLWIDSDDGMIYVATTTAGGWLASPDQRIATALTNAGAAQTTANSKTTVFAQVSAPSTTGRTTGDIWIDTDDGNKIYDWSGTWTVRLFGAPAISATARDLGAITTYFQISQPSGVLKVGDLWVDTDDNNKSRRYNGSTWDIITDPQIATALANAATAQTAANTANTTVATKVTAFYQVSAPATTGRTVGDLWIDIDDTNRVYRWDGTGAWVATPFGTNAISTVVPGQITTGALAPGTRWIAGSEVGSHVEITDTGFYAYGEDPVDGVPNLSVRVGTSDNDLFSITDSQGHTMASISDEGIASFQKVYALQDPDIAGSPLMGNLLNYSSPTEQGDSNPGLLDVLPRGIVAYGVMPGGTRYNVRQAIRELSFEAQPGRSYRVHFGGAHTTVHTANVSTGYSVGIAQPATIGGEAPTPNFSNTTTVLFSQNSVDTAGMTVTMPASSKALRCNPGGVSVGGELTPGIVKLLLIVLGDLANFTPSSIESIVFWVEDIGPDIPATSISNTSTPTTGQVSQPTLKTYTTTWSSTNYATYRADGGKRTDTTDVVQGYSSYNGDGEGLWIFPSVTSALSGATVKKVEVYAYANHWYYNSGGTAFIKVHGYTTEPATNPTMTTAITSANWPKPGGRWVTLPSSFWAGFKSGSYRGFGVGPAGSSNLLYYGRFNGSGAKLRITYTK